MAFTSHFFKNNRQKLRETTSAEVMVVTAHGLLQRSNDTTYPFRQDSNFWYLTGINEPDVVLVMDESSEYLIVPMRDDTRVAFDGSIDEKDLRRISGVRTVLSDDEGWKRLEKSLKKASSVGTMHPAPGYIEGHGFYTNPARRRLVRRMKSYQDKVKYEDLRPIMAELRMIKQPEEIEAIQHAIDITVEAFQQVKQKLGEFESEAAIDAELTAHFRRSGAIHAYSPIVAADKNACILHYIANSSALSKRPSVLIDAGAEYNMYAADITRTYALKPSQRQLAVAKSVEVALVHALSILKPGVIMKEYEEEMETFVGKELKALGLITSISRETVRKFFPHASSHFLGLDVHDVGNYKEPLRAGAMLTVEPGIYIPEENFGIRIEDNILITEKGNEVLSKLLPRSLA